MMQNTIRPSLTGLLLAAATVFSLWATTLAMPFAPAAASAAAVSTTVVSPAAA